MTSVVSRLVPRATYSIRNRCFFCSNNANSSNQSTSDTFPENNVIDDGTEAWLEAQRNLVTRSAISESQNQTHLRKMLQALQSKTELKRQKRGQEYRGRVGGNFQGQKIETREELRNIFGSTNSTTQSDALKQKGIKRTSWNRAGKSVLFEEQRGKVRASKYERPPRPKTDLSVLWDSHSNEADNSDGCLQEHGTEIASEHSSQRPPTSVRGATPSDYPVYPEPYLDPSEPVNDIKKIRKKKRTETVSAETIAELSEVLESQFLNKGNTISDEAVAQLSEVFESQISNKGEALSAETSAELSEVFEFEQPVVRHPENSKDGSPFLEETSIKDSSQSRDAGDVPLDSLLESSYIPGAQTTQNKSSEKTNRKEALNPAIGNSTDELSPKSKPSEEFKNSNSSPDEVYVFPSK